MVSVHVPQGEKAAGGEEAGAQGAADLPMGSWSGTPRDVLECILDKLKGHRDVLLFSSVCVAWRSFISENLQRFPTQLPLARCLCQLPLLMLPSKEATKACDFFCVFEQKFYAGTPLPDSNNCIWGSSKGWLATEGIRGSEIHLFNPISGDQIYLPPKTKIPRPKWDRNQIGHRTFAYLSKAALSKSPASNIQECVVMAIVSNSRVLSFCRLGDTKWTIVPDSPIYVNDILYYKGQFYAVNTDGVVVACDTGPSPKATAVVGAPKMDFESDDEFSDMDVMYSSPYLVESQGELLQVVKTVYAPDSENEGGVLEGCIRTDFKVFSLQEKGSEDDEDEEDEYETIKKIVRVKNSRYKWVELDNLCDQIIFLGLNQSLSLPAGALPNSRGNCIYFVDDEIDWRIIKGNIPKGCDDIGVFSIGVFNMEDGSVHLFHLKDLAFRMPPVWVSPTPW